MKKENTFFMNRQNSMWKILLLSSFFYFFVFALNAQEYCVPTSSSTDYLNSIEISSTLGNISYSTSSQPNNPAKGYDDLSDIETLDVTPGETIEVNTLYVGGSNTVKIWVDWNNDGVFDDDELMDEHYASSSVTLNELSFDIPNNANGEYRIRVRGRFSTSAFNACEQITFGSAVDFTLNVIDLEDCAEAEAGDIVGDTDRIVCAGAFFSLEVEGQSGPANGLTRTWQFSPAGEDDWTDLDISNSILNVTEGVLDATDYRYYVGCENGDEDYSEVISVTLNPNSIDCYCEPTYGTSTSDRLSEVSTEGAESDINYTSSVGGAHFDQTDLVLQTYANQEFELHTAYIGGMQTIGVWIDWNDNGYFGDQDEQIFLNYASSPQNFTVLIPADVENGQYRMRIRGVYGNKESEENDFICNHQTYGSSIDITLEVIDTPLCIIPVALAIEDITADSAEINWIGNSDSYNIEYGIAGFELGSGTLIEAINPPYNLSDLTPNTDYEIYVQANCEDDELSDWNLTSLKTACASITEMTEDFEAYDTGSFLPDCWERVIEGSGSLTISSTTPASGTRNIYMYASTATNRVMAVLPEFSNVSEGTHWLKFKVRSSTSNGTLKLGYITEDENAINDFVELETISVPNTTYTDSEQTFIIPDNIPTDARLAILNPGINTYSFYLDDFIWEEAPSCFVPENISVENITTDSAEITWEGDAGSYNIEWGEAGFEQGEGNMIEETDTPYELTNLNANTAYEVYIQAVCGENDESLWVGPIFFATACSATDVPFLQDFEDITTPEVPNCAVLETNSGNAWKTTSTSSNGFSGKVLQYTYHGSATADSWYFTQGINLEQGKSYRISYLYGSNSSSYLEKLKVTYGSSASSDGVIEELADHQFSFNVAETDEIEFEVDEDGVYYFGFQAYSAANQYYIYIDNIEVIELSVCENVVAGSPENDEIVICALTTFTLKIEGSSLEDPETSGITGQWETSTDNGSTWEEIEGANTMIYTVTDGISEDTQYRFVVTCSENSSEDISDVINVSINTNIADCYCEPSFPSGVEPITYVEITDENGQSLLENSSSAATSSPAYEDYTDISATLFIGETYDIAVEGNSNGSFTNKVTVYIDWNQDGVFSEGEAFQLTDLYNTTGTDGQQATGEIIVPGNAVPGETTMRIIKKFSSVANSCNTSGYGQAEDYTIIVDGEPIAECEAPEDLEIDDITETSAFVIWEPGMDPEESNGWEVVYGPEGFDIDADEGTSIIVDDAPFVELEDLDPDTAYEVYVRTICEEDQYSDWVSESFTTEGQETILCEPQRAEHDGPGGTNPYKVDAITEVELENLNDTEQSTDSFIDNTGSGNIADLAAGQSYTLSVSGNGGGNHFAAAWIDFNQNNTFEESELLGVQSTGAPGSVDINFTIPESATEGQFRLRVVWQHATTTPASPDPCTEADWGQTKDYLVSISSEEPSDICEAPEGLEIDDITETSAFVIWEPGMDPEDSNGWEVVYGPEGFDIDGDEGTSIIVEDAPFVELEDLDSDTAYEVYVRTICDEDQYSDWANTSFSTEGNDEPGSSYCEGSYFDEDNDGGIGGFNTSNGVTNINNMNIQDHMGYHDFTDMVVTQTAGESFDFYVDIKSGNILDEAEVAIYIDFNNDYEFSSSEQVYLSFGWVVDDSGIITIPVGTPAGNYRMRVVSDYWIVEDACDVTGSIHDYTLTVLEGDDCETPEGLEIDDITDHSAFVIWEPGMDPEDSNGWEVIYGPEGFDIDGDEGIPLIVEDAPFVELEDLDPDTTYEVYVRTICEDNQYSDWVSESFTTEEADQPIDDCEAPMELQIGEVTDSTAEVSWTPQGNETAWLVVYGETGADEEDFNEALVLEPNYTLENLDPETDYDVYVMAVCDEDEDVYSDASEILTFQTAPMSVDAQIFEDFSFYPNPVENVLNLQANAQIEMVSIHNLLGQKVIEVRPNTLETQIDAQQLQSGVYLMTVSIDGANKTFRIIKR